MDMSFPWAAAAAEPVVLHGAAASTVEPLAAVLGYEAALPFLRRDDGIGHPPASDAPAAPGDHDSGGAPWAALHGGR